MTSSLYLREEDRAVARSRGSFKKLVASLLLAFVFVTFASSTILQGQQQTVAAQEEESFDVVRWAMCLFGEDSMPAMIYQTTQSSDLQFALQSKSVISPGVDDIEMGPLGMNWMLDVTGGSFKKTNEAILGHPLDPTETKPDAGAAKFNGGTAVNPFDRFGVAGLNWTSYAGEWKYVIIKACQSGQFMDPKAAMFYEKRLPPMSVWDDRNNSLDVRTQQHAAGVGTSLLSSFINLVSNFIFNIAKLVIVVTLSLINFAFSDLVKLMGLDQWIVGTDTKTGMFGKLFSGIFEPFIMVAFTLTGLNILWHGIVKRQFRNALNVLIRSLALFFTAFLIAANPAFFISMPNNISVGMQALLVTGLNQGLAGGNGLCATNQGITNTKIVTNTGASDANILEQASVNMRSAIGCSFWQQFLLKPWVQGQFGDDWNKVWAKGKVPSWAPAGATALENGTENATMVGNADVPLGGGTVIHNWAIFQISTQTNVHSPIGHSDQYSKYTSGVANDWWRIVDVLANYEELTKTAQVGAQGESTDQQQDPGEVTNETVVTYSVPKNNPRLNSWDQWVGNNIFSRLGTALSAVFVALIGVIAPLFFAFLTAVYAIGLGLLMAFAPLMLLLGCWAGPGWEIFKSWGQLVVNTMMKRIAAGVLMVLSIAFSAAAIKIMETESWWEGIMLMVLLSVILIRSRHKVIDAFAYAQFAKQDLSGGASKISGAMTGTVKSAKTLTFAGLVGGVAAKKSGGSAIQGMGAGMGTEFRNLGYRNAAVRSALRTFDSTKQMHGKSPQDSELFDPKQFCSKCDNKLDEFDFVYLDNVGNTYCQECANDLEDKIDLREVAINAYNNVPKTPLQKVEVQSAYKKISRKQFTMKGTGTDDIPAKLDETTFKDKVSEGLAKDMNTYRKLQLDATPSSPPQPPGEIAPYLDINNLKLAWEKGQWDAVNSMYASAWALWAMETFKEPFAGLVEELLMEMNFKENELLQEEGSNGIPR